MLNVFFPVYNSLFIYTCITHFSVAKCSLVIIIGTPFAFFSQNPFFMRYSILLAGLLVAIIFTACRRQADFGPVYSGKVIKNVCGNIVVQVTDAGFGEAVWDDDGKRYKNVFTVDNPCNWNPYGVTSENIRFRIVHASPQSCAQCLMLASVPDTRYNILVEKQ